MEFFKDADKILCIANLSYFPAANAVAIDLPKTSLLQQPSNHTLTEFDNSSFSAEVNHSNVRLCYMLWEPRDDTECTGRTRHRFAVNQMDCFFPC